MFNDFDAPVNPAEWYRIHGPLMARVANGLPRPKRQAVGADPAGRVEAVGRDVEEFRAGDEVFGTSGGSWAEYAAAREVAPGAEAGERVVRGGSCCAGRGNHHAVGPERSHEVDVPRAADGSDDYTQADFTRLAERHELMLDIAGSRPFSKVKRVLTPEATVVLVGARMTRHGIAPLTHTLKMSVAAVGRSQTVTFFLARITKEDLDVLRELLEAGKVRPVIDRRYELSEIRDALRYFREGHARGKVVLTV